MLLKGSTTLVLDPSGRLFSQASGTGWMATAGSGDVLAGVLGAILAQGRISHAEAAAAAALVHGEAGSWAAGHPPGPLLAHEIAIRVSKVIAYICDPA